MLSSVYRLLKILSVLVATGVVAGCISARAPVTRFYLLTPMDFSGSETSRQGSQAALSVVIAAVRLPQYLERPQIVTRSSENRLELAEFDQWGGNLRKNLKRVLAMNLAGLLENAHIVVAPHGLSGHSDFRVEVDVLEFERAAAGRVRLSAHWLLSKGSDRIPLVTRTTEWVEPGDGSPDPIEKTVMAMSRLAGDLSRTIAQEIVKQRDNAGAAR